ncbi:MAG TPA: hypothetical protein VM533_09855 [Fimbriiglobus sp.]|nr:hypothetical protein [Fimbriiglobus sp.]
MKLRLLTAAAALAFGAAPAVAQADKTSGPAVTAQLAPLGKALTDVKAIVRTVAGDGAVKQMEEAIKEGLGEKGFDGVDLLRPAAGYVNLDKVETFEDPKNITGVLLVPITDEKAFVEFLKRVKLDVEPVEGKAGLYRIDPRDGESAPFPVRMRFADRYAHIGFNVKDDALAADKLVPAAKLVNPAERGLFAYTTYYSRLPKELIDQAFKQTEQAAEQIKQAPLPPGAAEPLAEAVKSVMKMNEQMYREGDVAVVRLVYEQATEEVVYETTLKAKPGTALAKEVAARKAVTHRFAGLIGDATAAALLAQLPTFTPEVRDAITGALEAARKSAAQEVPQEYQAAADEALAGLARSVKSGEFDLGAALIGPDKDGTFTVVAGVSFDDPAKLEKELRALHAKAPEEVRKQIKLDAAKAGDVSVHQIEAGPMLPPEAQKVFGEKASVCVAFAPKAIHVAFGPAAVESIQAAVAAKPGPAKALDLVVNPARVQKLAAAVDPQAGEQAARALGTDDKKVSAFSISVEGGDELRVRVAVALKVIPRAIVQGTMAFGDAQP